MNGDRPNPIAKLALRLFLVITLNTLSTDVGKIGISHPHLFLPKRMRRNKTVTFNLYSILNANNSHLKNYRKTQDEEPVNKP